VPALINYSLLVKNLIRNKHDFQLTKKGIFRLKERAEESYYNNAKFINKIAVAI